MTSLELPTDVPGAVDAVESDAGSAHAPRCVACAHPLDDHDAIEKRYCNATQAHALPRTCICRTR